MRIIFAAAVVAALTSVSAIAQTSPSTTDAPAPSGQGKAADPKQSSPGATGAMHNEAAPIATSPQDVKQQQEGKGTAAMPKDGNDAGAAGAKSSPGAVGASPGSDSNDGKPK